MPIAAFVAGRYSCAYSSADLGATQKGWELEFMFKQEAVDETDVFGSSTVDLVRRGADVFLNAQITEWTAATRGLLWAFGGSMGTISNAANPIGTFASDSAAALVMSSTASTPAATAPASLTAAKAFIAGNYNPKVPFDSRWRTFPLRMQFLPTLSSGTVSLFTTS